MENKIILEATGKLQDDELRDWVAQLNTKIDTINERTKQHTLDIRELKHSLKTRNANVSEGKK